MLGQVLGKARTKLAFTALEEPPKVFRLSVLREGPAVLGEVFIAPRTLFLCVLTISILLYGNSTELGRMGHLTG